MHIFPFILAPLHCLLLPSCAEIEKMVMIVGKQLQKLVGDLKSKLKKPLKLQKPYSKMDKTDSMRVEIKSRKAQKLIADTLKIADSPTGCRSYAF